MPSLPHRSAAIKEKEQDPITGLIKLYSCNPDAINELSKCRINPNMSSIKNTRDDLEFYIPELLSFYLQGYFDNSE